MTRTFGQYLRGLRRSREVSQRELAERVGVDFSYISKVENGRVPPPSGDTIARICEVLSVPSDELLAMTGKMPTQIRRMVSASTAAQQFMRQAHAMDLTDEEWERLTQGLKGLRSE